MTSKFKVLSMVFALFTSSANANSGIEPPGCDEILEEIMQGLEVRVNQPNLERLEWQELRAEIDRINALKFYEDECKVLKTIPDKYKPELKLPTSFIGRFFKWAFGD